MEAVLTDAALRDNMIGRGIDRSRRFSWDAAAQRLLQLYERAMGA
jgi:hypothetical protein